MMDKLKGFWARLDRRLITLICLAVLPINCLAIWFSSLAVSQAQEKVILSQVSEFTLLTRENTAELQDMEQWLSNYISDHLNTLVQSRSFDAIFSISATNEVAKHITDEEIIGFSFVQEQKGEKKLYFRSSDKSLPLSQMDVYKQALSRYLVEKQTGSSFHEIRNLNGSFFYCSMYNLNNYSLGYALDLQQLLNQWKTNLLQDCRIRIQDTETILQTDEFGRLNSAESVNKKSLAQAPLGQLLIELCENNGSNQMSAAYFMLQCLAWGSLGLLVLLWLMIRRQVIKPLIVLKKGMEQLEKKDEYRIDTIAGSADFAYLYSTFNQMAEMIQKSHEKDVIIYQTQLNNLKLQVNPHMLLNSLTMIYSLAQTKQNDLI